MKTTQVRVSKSATFIKIEGMTYAMTNGLLRPVDRFDMPNGIPASRWESNQDLIARATAAVSAHNVEARKVAAMYDEPMMLFRGAF